MTGFLLELQNTRGEAFSMGKSGAVILALSLALSLPCTIAAQKLLIFRSCHLNSSPAVNNKKPLPFIYTWLIVLLVWLPCYLAFYPGILCYDCTVQLSEFFYGNFSTHHPLAHTLLMGECIELGYRIFGSYNIGAALYTGFQLSALAAAVAYAMYSIQKLKITSWIKWAALIFYLFMPVIPVVGVSSTKDVLFSALFTAAVVKGMGLCEKAETAKISDWIGFLLLLILTALFRNNALYAFAAAMLVVALMAMLVGNRKLKAFALVLLLSMIGGKAALAGLQYATNAEAGSRREMFSVPVQQLGRVLVEHYNELGDEEMSAYARYFPPNIMFNYNPVLSDPLKDYLYINTIEENPGKPLTSGCPWGDVFRETMWMLSSTIRRRCGT